MLDDKEIARLAKVRRIVPWQEEKRYLGSVNSSAHRDVT